MPGDVSDAMLIGLIGLCGGIVLGLAARLGRFCTLGAVEDYLYQQNDTRLRMWGLAIGVAGLTAFGAAGMGGFDIARNVYWMTPWSPFGSILGGLMFGYGMSLAGTCGFGALARLGGGDLRSFVIVLVMGIAAYIMMSGPLAPLRITAMAATTPALEAQSYAQVISRLTGLPMIAAGLLMSGGIGLAALGARRFRENRTAVIWGALAGLAITSGWIGTSWVATHGFMLQPVQSHTFSAPLGETILFLMTASGGGSWISFGVASVLGVVVGSFFGSVIKGHFRWEACEDPRELKRQMLGAVCMGFGAVLAFGCTVGQGMSAFSVLSLSAPVTFAAIFAGAALGLRQLITGLA